MALAGEEQLSRSSAFSYQCSACNRCCRNYEIRVNPYEALVLARHLNISTTELLERHLDNGRSLPLRDDGSCRFLGERGCTIHAARPLACRLYPLARFAGGGQPETFRHMVPHPLTEGVYGLGGTVAEFLDQQKAQPFIEAGDRYLDVLCQFINLLEQMMNDGGGHDMPNPSITHEHLFDPDSTIGAAHPELQVGDLDPQYAMELHISILLRWINENTSREIYND